MPTSKLRTRVTLVLVHLFVATAVWIALSASGCSSTDSVNNPTPDASDASNDITAAADHTMGTGNCTGSLTSCSGSCVNTTDDPKNCGSCGATCSGGLVCSSGTCAVGCQSGQTLCGAGSCANLQTDFDNCGTCGKACAAGQVCNAGSCSLYCSPPTTSCNGSCVNEQNDTNNCGGCGKACGTGLVCAGGNCGVSCGLLTTCTTDAGAFCTNTQTDSTNCGTCGTICPGGEVCSMGQCQLTCQTGLLNCNGTCIDPTSDQSFCGATGACGAGDSGSPGTTCPAGQACGGGVCAISCPPGQVACNGACVDPTSNNTFCGATPGCGVGDAGTAGTTCGGGLICSVGTCQATCAKNLVLCTVSGQATCVDPTTSPSFCGATAGCGVADAGTAGSVCTAGTVCASGTCAVSCAPPTLQCPGLTGTCINPQSDPNFCGATGNCLGISAGQACPSGRVCTTGVCAITCVLGQQDCQNQCIDPNSSVTFCGAHNNCSLYTTCIAGQICSDGGCVLSCQTGLVNCNVNGTPTCVDPMSNRNFCGANSSCSASSYAVCPPGQVCASGNCQTSCLASEAQCNSQCINPLTDSTNCGAAAGGMCSSSVTASADYQGVNCAATVGGSTCNGAGSCACPTVPTTPPHNEIACVGSPGTLCLDPQTNTGYCGAKGLCTPGDNTPSDPNFVGVNCAATAGQTCLGGTCTCPYIPGSSPATLEPVCTVGTTPSCIDPTTNNAFCGADSNCSVSSYVNCGSIPGSSCSQQAGQAKPMCNCPAGQLNCGGACVDPTTNPNFCGATGNCTNTGAGNSTGNVCSANSLTTCGLKPGSNGVYYCETKCTSASDPGTGQLACGINQPGAYCANYQTDNSNCGNCGVSCGSPAVTLTTCGPDSGVTPPAPGDLPFGCNSICPAGQNACILGTSYCTNLSTDPNNCGDGGANIDGSTNGCGNKCGTGLVCTSGTCTSTCGSPETQCGADAGGACANLNNDPNNCGTCGTACGTGLACLQNPGGSAAPAQCCTTNYNTVCNNTAAPPVPTCVDTTTDNNNCGSCGQVCPLYHAHASTPTTCVNSTPPSCNVHSDGLNSGWDDDTAPSTFSAAEALTACQTWEKANGLSNGCIAAQTVCESGYSGAYDNNFIWWYTDPDGGAGQTIAGEVTVYTCSTLPPTGIPVVSHWY